MKKTIIWILLFTVIVLNLNSCSSSEYRSDNQIADDTLKAIMEAIDSQDKEAFKSLFSKNAISKDEDFEDDLNDLFELRIHEMGGVDGFRR